MRKTRYFGVFTDGRGHFTINSVPGVRVYGERLIKKQGKEYRQWDPMRSKLAALLKKGTQFYPIKKDSNILYLGASSGTTVSHVSDICFEGIIYALDPAPRPFQKLHAMAGKRTNIIPILEDAQLTEKYSHLVAPVDIVYQDVSQRNQGEIFQKNMNRYLKPGGTGILMIKARSIDVTQKTDKIVQEVVDELAKKYEIVDVADISSFHEGHSAITIIKRK